MKTEFTSFRLARCVLNAVLGLGLLLPRLMEAQPAATNPTNATLRVGISPVFPPMAYKKGKELAGVETELAQLLGAELGRKVEFVELPWADQLEALSAGKTDIIMSSMSITPVRRHLASFTKPYFIIGQMALVRREDKHQYALGFPMTLPGTPGVLKATTGAFLVERDFPKSKSKVFTTPEDAAAALKKNRIDLFVSDSTLTWYLAGVHAAEGLAIVPLALTEEPLGWAVRKTDEALLASADVFIERALKDGTMRKVFRRWGATGE